MGEGWEVRLRALRVAIEEAFEVLEGIEQWDLHAEAVRLIEGKQTKY